MDFGKSAGFRLIPSKYKTENLIYLLPACAPLFCVEQRKTPPLSQPIRKAVSSSALNDTQVTPICLLVPTLARRRRGRHSVSNANLNTYMHVPFYPPIQLEIWPEPDLAGLTKNGRILTMPETKSGTTIQPNMCGY